MTNEPTSLLLAQKPQALQARTVNVSSSIDSVATLPTRERQRPAHDGTYGCVLCRGERECRSEVAGRVCIWEGSCDHVLGPPAGAVAGDYEIRR